MISVSVIIPHHNNWSLLYPCLQALNSQSTSDFEIIIIDNASTDDSVAQCRTHYPQVHIIQNTVNRGTAGGLNDGFRQASGKYLVTLNNDTIPHHGFIRELIQAAEKNPSVGMFAAKMIFPNGQINSTGICISRSGAAWDRGMFEKDNGQYNTMCQVFGPCGGAALYRRNLIEDIGYLDEDFFMFFDDVDLAFRARLAGWECLYIPTAVVTHIHGASAGYQSDISIYYGNRNTMWLPIKNLPAQYLLYYFPWILGRNVSIFFYYLYLKKGRVIASSKIDGLRGLMPIVKKRKEVKRKKMSNVLPFIHRWADIPEKNH